MDRTKKEDETQALKEEYRSANAAVAYAWNDPTPLSKEDRARNARVAKVNALQLRKKLVKVGAATKYIKKILRKHVNCRTCDGSSLIGGTKVCPECYPKYFPTHKRPARRSTLKGRRS